MLYLKISKLVLLIFFVLYGQSLFSNTYYLKNDSKKSLSEIINESNSYDTIVISKSIIFESSIKILKPLTIIGVNYPTIDANSKGGNIIYIKSNNVNINGIKVKNVERASISDNAAIKIESSENCIIENCIIENAFFGIYLAKSISCNILNNQILGNSIHESSSGNGIHLWQCNRINVLKNKVFRQRDGIYFEFVKFANIAENISTENLRYGLHFMFSDSCQYLSNTFQKNGAGVAVMYTHKVLMENNIFIDNWGPSAYGLLLKDITDSKICNNKFINNTVGIYSEGSNRMIVEKNEFKSNGWAIRLMANCKDNNFTLNNFISNTFEVSTNSRQNYNKFNKNYWSSYSGYDLNRDGKGDVPFHPVRLFSLLVAQQESAMILLHSFFIELLDLAERIFPFLTPATLIDSEPQMKVIV
jgi:nitrous oxidase accessory protein